MDVNAIQIKSYFGGWKTVDRNHAKRFISKMIDGGCIKSKIEGSHLRGISLTDLLNDEDGRQETDSLPTYATTREPPIQIATKLINPNMVGIADCIVEIEDLARKEAFYKFQQNILFSLTVWQNDETIRKTLPPVQMWVGDCVDKLNLIARRF
jgi:hypothetical protein